MVNKRLLSLCDESKKWIGMTVLMNWISIICNIAIVVYIGNVIDKLYNNDFNINILGSAVFILAMLGIRFVCNFLSTKFSSKSSTEVRKGLRSKIYQKLLDLGVNYKDTISTSSTVQISVDGVEALEIYFGRYLPQLFYSLLAPLTLFVVVAPISFKAAIVLLICVPLIPVSIVAVMKFAKKLLGKYWGIYTNLGDSFLENLHGLTTLKIYDLDEEKNEDPEKKNTALFWFPTGKKAPFAISIAGGGYNGVCSLMEGFPVAAKLNEMGINAFVLDYRAGTDDAADKSEEDLHRAIQFIFENKERFQLEDSYAVVGFSAGGHLTAEFGTDNRGYKTADLPKPEMLGLGYACVNLEFTEEEKKQQLSEDMFGKNREKEYYIAKRNEFTVLDHISSNYPPAFIWHTMEDELIPYEDNAVAMKEILDCVGVRNQLKCVKHGLHGLGLGTGSEAQGWLEEAVAFWKNQK